MKKFFSMLLSIILCLILIVEISYISVSNSITEEKIQNSVQEILIDNIIKEDNSNSNNSIFNKIINQEGLKVEEKITIKKVLETNTGKQVATDIATSIYEYNLTGDKTKKYTEEKLLKTVNTNFDKILKEMNYNISESEKQEIINYVKVHANEIVDKMYDVDIGAYLK